MDLGQTGSQKVFITTPIYYVNGDPHLGHAHTTVMADIFKRILQLSGKSVYLTTGVDEHGQKNQLEIEKRGLSRQQFLDGQAMKFRKLFDLLGISCNYFVRTSEDSHKRTVTYILERLWSKGLITRKKYTGLYCEGCEQFKLESDLDGNGCCPDHRIKPKTESEENYFFCLEQDREFIISYIRDNPGWIYPEACRNKVLDMLSQPLEDLCISRPKSRVTLGIDLPFDNNYVVYVWFDALINYISVIGYPNADGSCKIFWENSCHLMARDIIKTHCIYWPIMLKAIGLPPVTRNLVHGFWVGEDGRKMSKSLGNGVDPRFIIDKYGASCLRAFLASKAESSEARIGCRLVESYYNSVLSNILGNAFFRTVKLLFKYREGIVPEKRQHQNNFLDELVRKQKDNLCSRKINFQTISGLSAAMESIGRKINGYIEDKAPWKLAADPDMQEYLDEILLTCLEAVRILFETAYPLMPEISDKVMEVFRLEPLSSFSGVFKAVPFRLKAGEKIDEAGILFPKINE